VRVRDKMGNVTDSQQKVKAGASALTGVAIKAVAQEFDWYPELSKQDRTYVDLVIKAGINAFVQWFASQDSAPTGVREIFDAAPVELTKTITLRQTLDLLRVIIGVIEQQADTIALPGKEVEVRQAVLQFSRDVAFGAAEVYAQAAELRGAWDARLQTQALEGLIQNESSEKIVAHFRALGWNTTAPVTAVVGTPPPDFSESAMVTLRRKLTSVPGSTLVGLHGDLLVMVYCEAADAAASGRRRKRIGMPIPLPTAKQGGLLERATKGYTTGLGSAGGRSDKETNLTTLPPGVSNIPVELLEVFGPGPLAIGPEVATIAEAGDSVSAALAAWRAAPGWAGATRPVLADDLLPERVLLGDDAARNILVNEVYRPIKNGKNLSATLAAYLENGRSLEAAARDLGIHVNTARYRLNNIAELTGWDPLVPREAYVLQLALTLGALTN